MQRHNVRNRDVWTGLGLLGVVAVYLYGTFQYSGTGQPGLPTARTLPVILMVLLTVLAVLVLWDGVRSAGPEAASSEDDDVLLVEEPSKARLGLAVLLLFAYLVAMPFIGFPIASVALGIVLQILIFRTRWWMAAVTTLVITGLAYWVFDKFLQIPLP